MAYVDMYSEITGSVPKLDIDLAKKLVNRAWSDIRRQNLWSFQLFEANWVSPSIINGGTVTTVQGTSTVTFDATAKALLNAVAGDGPFPTPLVQRQFRQSSTGTIYNIWAWNSSTGVATLDRPYVEPSGTLLTYMVYQCYYPAPMQDWLTWISVVDRTNFNDLNTLTTRAQLDAKDPQRTIFYLPTDVAPYQLDQNPQSATYQWQLFELWGQPQYVLPYQLYGIRRGVALVNDADALPQGGLIVGEDAVIEGAKIKAYEWAEANKGDMPRNAGADFRFLIGNSKAEFGRLIKSYRKDDRERVDNWYTVRRRRNWLGSADGYFNAIANTANPGAPW
jgi:hypothetical protein